MTQSGHRRVYGSLLDAAASRHSMRDYFNASLQGLPVGWPRAMVPLRASSLSGAGSAVIAYLPTARAAMALSISALTADILKLAAACIGGKSISVCAALPTTCWTNTKRQNSYANQL
jgi:hypothetical protein